MRRFVFFILCIFFTALSWADTLDTWQVRVNDSILVEFNELSPDVNIYIDSSSMNLDDSLTILHNTDTPCINCHRAFIARDSSTHTKIESIKPLESTEATFSLHKLLQAKEQRSSEEPMEIILVKKKYVDMKTGHWELVRIHFQ